MEIMKSTTRPASQTDELVDTKSSEAKNWRHPLRMQNERGKSDAVSLEMLILSTRGLGGAALLDSEAMAAIMIFLIDQILFLRGHTAASLQEMRRPAAKILSPPHLRTTSEIHSSTEFHAW
ncbi:hypothetical protein TGRH88_074610 [Toxoplasma gondii]|uniref:Uncharacterized protein n=1 Tax=Toxoplasma gondii TaxID=5811 RepID=A0A7J6K587_TOXGO|nr:hypothetical protein TGRH88_074610 [Toxoplasma gondii]